MMKNVLKMLSTCRSVVLRSLRSIWSSWSCFWWSLLNLMMMISQFWSLLFLIYPCTRILLFYSIVIVMIIKTQFYQFPIHIVQIQLFSLLLLTIHCLMSNLIIIIWNRFNKFNSIIILWISKFQIENISSSRTLYQYIVYGVFVLVFILSWKSFCLLVSFKKKKIEW